jgi:hypothetical protein
VSIFNRTSVSDLRGLVYRSIRGTTRLIGKGLDAGMAPVIAILPASESSTTRDAARTPQIPENCQWLGYATGHIELLGCPQVYAQMRDWLVDGQGTTE